MSTRRLGVVVAIAMCSVAGFMGHRASAAPVYVYSNISGAADIENSVTGRPVGNVNLTNPNSMYAQGFTSGTANLTVQSITLGLAADTSVSTALVRIFSSISVSGTAMPNAALATFVLSGTSAVLDLDPYVFTGSYSLAASTPYWVVVSDSGVPDSSYNYYDVESDATPSGTDGYAYLGTRRSSNGSTWLNFATGDALSIGITAVPEPSTYALAAVGLGIAAGLRARRRKSAV